MRRETETPFAILAESGHPGVVVRASIAWRREGGACLLALVIVISGCGARTLGDAPSLPTPPDAGASDAAFADASVIAADAAPPPPALDAGCAPQVTPLPEWIAAPGSVTVRAAFEWSGSAPDALGAPLEFTLALVPGAGGITGVGHSRGARHLQAASLALASDSLECVEAGCSLGFTIRSDECAGWAELELVELKLESVDLDCDGARDEVRGVAQVRARTHDPSGTRVVSHDGLARLRVERDESPPRVWLESGDLGGAPLRALRLVPSEPLSTMTRLDVVGSLGTLLRIEPDPEHPWIVERELRAPGPLPAMERVYTSSDGRVSDFSGNVGTAEAMLMGWQGLSTPHPEDGFESGVGVHVEGGARVAGAMGGLRPIEGASSLWLPPGQLPDDVSPRWAVVRLAPAAGATRVSFALRVFGASAALGPSERLDAALLDESGELDVIDLSEDARLEPTGLAAIPFASATRRVALVLGARSTEGPIHLVVRVQSVTCGQPAPGAHGIQLDQLHAE